MNIREQSSAKLLRTESGRLEGAVRFLAGIGVWLMLAGGSMGQQPGLPACGWPAQGATPIPLGYFQPVEFIAPPGTSISMAANGAFTEPLLAPLTAGLYVRPIYRLRVSGIPGFESREVFPTIELLDHLCAPPGQEARFPIPIELTAEDLRLAVEGHFITRVIYVENPETARAASEDPVHPTWFDAGPGVNPLDEARQLGRPVAILRLGGRLPDSQTGPDMQFLNGCPPFALIRAPAKVSRPLPPVGEPEPVTQAAVRPLETVRR